MAGKVFIIEKIIIFIIISLDYIIVETFIIIYYNIQDLLLK